MQFALNYSPQAADLLRSGQIDIDLFKCPAWPDMIAEARQLRPVYVHFPLVAGQHNVESVGLAQIAALREDSATPYVNSHLGARYEDLQDPDNADQALETMLSDVRPLVDCFGADQVILENVPYPDVFQDKPAVVSRPDVIRQAIETSDCGLLLDLAHAKLSAESLAMDVHAYIEQLPLDRLREIHVTGVGLDPTGFRQDHLPMTDDDWALFDWALAHIRAGDWPAPWVLACEYGGIGPLFDWRSDAAVILNDVPRMAAAVAEANSRQGL